MKFRSLFLLFAVFSCLTLLSAEPLVWNGSNKFENWKQFFRVNGEIVNGNLKLTSIRIDCSTTNTKVNINPDDYNAFTFRYRANGTSTRTGEFYFAPAGEKFSDSRKWLIPSLNADGQWHTMTVMPKDYNSWKTGGNIVQLRFDPTNGPGGEIEISEMKLEYIDSAKAPKNQNAGQAPAKQPEWNKSNQFSGWTVAHNLKRELHDGNLYLTATGPDCRLSNLSVSVDTEKYNAFCFRYRTKNIVGGGTLFFTHPGEPFSESRSWAIPPLNADGQWHTATVRPADLTSWQKGKIVNRLRFDPTNSLTGEIEISEIKFIFLDKPIFVPQDGPLATDDVPEWPKVKGMNISKQIGEHYFLGKMLRAPQDMPKRQHYSFCVRRSFFLKEKPLHGLLQFTADDCAEAYVNGSRGGSATDWQQTYYLNVTRSLTAGENILAFEYFNDNGAGGLLCELYIQYADGSSERISSDKSFVSSPTRVDNWNKIGFDDSKWDRMVEQLPPPNKPWTTVLPYRYFDKIQTINKVTVSPGKVNAGEKVTLSFSGEGKLPDRDITFTVEFRNKDKLLWSETLVLPKKNISCGKDNLWSADLVFNAPKYLSSNNISLKIISDEFVLTDGSEADLNIEFVRMKNDPDFPAARTKIEKNSSGVTLVINGKPFMPLWGQPSPMRRRDKKFRINDAKIDLLTVNCDYGEWWIGCDKYDFSKLDYSAEAAERENPEAYFIWDITFRLPKEWAKKYSNELSRTEKGYIADTSKTTFSFSSAQARQDMLKALEEVINYLENSPYANRIIGYRISGGETIEWLGWNSSEALDFSDVSKRAFTEFCREHYPELKNPAIPTESERRSLDKNLLLWDPQKHLNTIAYFDFYSNSVADMIIALTSKAKSMTGTRKVIAAFYGYTATLQWTGIAQNRAHYALKKLLNSGSVDILMSPNSYVLRGLGDIVGDMKPFTSLHSNKILPVIEDDTRTHNGTNVRLSGDVGTQNATMSEAHSIAVLRRNMGVAACRGIPFYIYPLVGGEEWDFPAATADFNIFRELGHWLSAKNVERRAEIALVVSEESIKSMPMNNKNVRAQSYTQQYSADGTVRKYLAHNPVLNRETFAGNQGRFCRSGAPVDILLAEDLKDNPGNYKLYVFLNSYQYDAEFLRAVEKLKQRKCTLLWLYAPGYIYNRSNSVESMNNLIGIKLEKFAAPAEPAVSMPDKRVMGTRNAAVSPLFYSADPAAKTIGTYSDGKPGIVTQNTGKALTVFSGVWELDMPFILDIAKRSGVHLFSEALDPLEANSSLIMIHARFPGKKRIKLPYAADVVDVFNRKIVAKNVSEFDYEMKIHESVLFYYGQDAEALLEKINKL